MTTIPDDIMQAARRSAIIAGPLCHENKVRVIAGALLAERERCARLFETVDARKMIGVSNARLSAAICRGDNP